jgi:predicted nuclease of restriction endonuclease-like RecB superfamily
MLTREQSISAVDYCSGLVIPDRLNQRAHAAYESLAEQMLEVYRRGVGKQRRELHREVHQVFEQEPECPLRRIEAFCKLLDDHSVYASQQRRNAAALRREVFSYAARLHPLVDRMDSLFENSAEEVRRQISQRLQREWQDISDSLFADVIDFHRLESFPGYAGPGELLSRYNVAQVQAALYSAISITVRAGADFKRILRAARLARLMHTITTPRPGCWQIELTGPASVLRETRRYGVNFARFLPALICCSDWTMEAIMESRGLRNLRLNLSSRDGLKSHLPADDEFDSAVEADFAEKWGQENREGWRLRREAEILHAGQKTFIPDFVMEHVTGQRVLLEIVGFWTPEYLEQRVETLQLFRGVPIVLAIQEANAARIAQAVQSAGMITFRRSLQVKSVLEVLRGLAGVIA